MEKEAGGYVYSLSGVRRKMGKSELKKKQVSEGLSPSGDQQREVQIRTQTERERAETLTNWRGNK